MLRLKATKTSLYKLVHDYEPLPPMRRTRFTKAYREPDYWLEWADADGLWCRAFLSSCGGSALLAVTRKEFCGPEHSRVVYGLGLPELRRRGKVEEFTTAVERRRLRLEAAHAQTV